MVSGRAGVRSTLADIEVARVHGQRLDRRLPAIPTARRKVAAWEQRRNAAKAALDWRFINDAAGDKRDPP